MSSPPSSASKGPKTFEDWRASQPEEKGCLKLSDFILQECLPDQLEFVDGDVHARCMAMKMKPLANDVKWDDQLRKRVADALAQHPLVQHWVQIRNDRGMTWPFKNFVAGDDCNLAYLVTSATMHATNPAPSIYNISSINYGAKECFLYLKSQPWNRTKEVQKVQRRWHFLFPWRTPSESAQERAANNKQWRREICPALIAQRMQQSRLIWQEHFGEPQARNLPKIARIFEANGFFFDAWGNLVADRAFCKDDVRSYAMFDVDHIFPVVRGGASVVGNMTAMYYGANRVKGDRIPNAMQHVLIHCPKTHKIVHRAGEVEELRCGITVEWLKAILEDPLFTQGNGDRTRLLDALAKALKDPPVVIPRASPHSFAAYVAELKKAAGFEFWVKKLMGHHRTAAGHRLPRAPPVAQAPQPQHTPSPSMAQQRHASPMPSSAHSLPPPASERLHLPSPQSQPSTSYLPTPSSTPQLFQGSLDPQHLQTAAHATPSFTPFPNALPPGAAIAHHTPPTHLSSSSLDSLPQGMQAFSSAELTHQHSGLHPSFGSQSAEAFPPFGASAHMALSHAESLHASTGQHFGRSIPQLAADGSLMGSNVPARMLSSFGGEPVDDEMEMDDEEEGTSWAERGNMVRAIRLAGQQLQFMCDAGNDSLAGGYEMGSFAETAELLNTLLPKIVVCGAQSSGKSTILNSLLDCLGVKGAWESKVLLTGSGCTTVFPVRICLDQQLHPGGPQHSLVKRLNNTTPSTQHLQDSIPSMLAAIREAQLTMARPATTDAPRVEGEVSSRFLGDEKMGTSLTVTLQRPIAEPMELVDVPGLIDSTLKQAGLLRNITLNELAGRNEEGKFGMGRQMCDCVLIVAKVTDDEATAPAVGLVTDLLRKRRNLGTDAAPLGLPSTVCIVLRHDGGSAAGHQLSTWKKRCEEYEKMGVECVVFVTQARLHPETEEVQALRRVPDFNSPWLGLGCSALARWIQKQYLMLLGMNKPQGTLSRLRKRLSEMVASFRELEKQMGPAEHDYVQAHISKLRHNVYALHPDIQTARQQGQTDFRVYRVQDQQCMAIQNLIPLWDPSASSRLALDDDSTAAKRHSLGVTREIIKTHIQHEHDQSPSTLILPNLADRNGTLNFLKGSIAAAVQELLRADPDADDSPAPDGFGRLLGAISEMMKRILGTVAFDITPAHKPLSATLDNFQNPFFLNVRHWSLHQAAQGSFFDETAAELQRALEDAMNKNPDAEKVSAHAAEMLIKRAERLRHVAHGVAADPGFRKKLTELLQYPERAAIDVEAALELWWNGVARGRLVEIIKRACEDFTLKAVRVVTQEVSAALERRQEVVGNTVMSVDLFWEWLGETDAHKKLRFAACNAWQAVEFARKELWVLASPAP